MLLSMQEVAALGPHSALGGFSVCQHPMVFGRKLVRQVRQGLADARRLAWRFGVGAMTPTPKRRWTQRPPCLTPRT